MLFERIQSKTMRLFNHRYLGFKTTAMTKLPGPHHNSHPKQDYVLYAHVPFCETLCPYCSFNRYPLVPAQAQAYFMNLQREMRMLKDMDYGFKSLYIGGGTPTIMIDELCQTIDLARELFDLEEVSTETNPNHLKPEYINKLTGRVQRLSVGVQSFDDGLLKQMERYDQYGSGMESLERVMAAKDSFDSLNVDMIFNFPSQTEDMLINDLAYILESKTSQVTFYPLMASPSVSRTLAQTLGQVDYRREERYYQIICEALTGGKKPPYTFSSAWTFDALENGSGKNAMIDEYIVDYEEYPAIGSGSLSYLDGSLYVNTFSVEEYNALIQAGHMSVVGRTPFSKWDRMRYRFMMQLFGLRLDKKQWERDFGCSVAAGLPLEYGFFKVIGAISYEDDQKILLSPRGRYLLVALMREFFIGVNKVRDEARAKVNDPGCQDCQG